MKSHQSADYLDELFAKMRAILRGEEPKRTVSDVVAELRAAKSSLIGLRQAADEVYTAPERAAYNRGERGQAALLAAVAAAEDKVQHLRAELAELAKRLG